MVALNEAKATEVVESISSEQPTKQEADGANTDSLPNAESATPAFKYDAGNQAVERTASTAADISGRKERKKSFFSAPTVSVFATSKNKDKKTDNIPDEGNSPHEAEARKAALSWDNFDAEADGGADASDVVEKKGTTSFLSRISAAGKKEPPKRSDSSATLIQGL